MVSCSSTGINLVEKTTNILVSFEFVVLADGNLEINFENASIFDLNNHVFQPKTHPGKIQVSSQPTSCRLDLVPNRRIIPGETFTAEIMAKDVVNLDSYDFTLF